MGDFQGCRGSKRIESSHSEETRTLGWDVRMQAGAQPSRRVHLRLLLFSVFMVFQACKRCNGAKRTTSNWCFLQKRNLVPCKRKWSTFEEDEIKFVLCSRHPNVHKTLLFLIHLLLLLHRAPVLAPTVLEKSWPCFHKIMFYCKISAGGGEFSGTVPPASTSTDSSPKRFRLVRLVLESGFLSATELPQATPGSWTTLTQCHL